jgi:hypothetical protein
MPPSRRVSPSERVRADIEEVFDSGRELGQILEEVARLGVRLLFQAAFEAEITEFLGRERYSCGERAHAGLRNGYAPITVKTTSGPVRLERPKLRGNPEPFASRLLGLGVTRTKALESLVIAGFVRGLSTRDVEATLAEALGEQAALSKSTVSRICHVLVDQFELWQRRPLRLRAGLSLRRRDLLQVPPGRQGGADLVHARDHHRGPQGLHRAQRRRCRELRQLACSPQRSPAVRPPAAPARHHRRQPGPDLGLRAGLPA